MQENQDVTESGSEARPTNKEELQEKLVRFQKKLVKIVQAENRLSDQYPLNRKRLNKQTETRYKIMDEIEDILCTLIDMGETFKVKIKKGLKSRDLEK